MEQKDQNVPANSLDEPAEGGNENPSPSTAAATTEANLSTEEPKKEKKLNPLKKFFKRFNIYFLLFIFICVIAAAVTAISYLNSKKQEPAPSIATQELNEETLKQLANSDATVGGSGQTLTVNGNAIFSGQILAKADLGVAGSIVTNGIRSGTEISAPQLTISTRANLNDTQVTNLQVSGSTTIQGPLTLQRDLSVAGNTSFNGPVTMNQLNVTNITMSGNGSLRVLNHIAFPGASPNRGSPNGSVLGAGGSISIGGSDTSGAISINTGTGPQPGCFTSFTFAQRYTSAPRVIVSPVGQAAGQTQYYVTRDTNGFSICTANAAPANSAFGFDYFVAQ